MQGMEVSPMVTLENNNKLVFIRHNTQYIKSFCMFSYRSDDLFVKCLLRNFHPKYGLNSIIEWLNPFETFPLF